MNPTLSNSWPFYYLPEDTIKNILQNAKYQFYSPGQSILPHEQDRKFAYVIVDGKVDRLSMLEGADHFEERLAPFSFFGFVSLLLGTKSRYHFRALSEVKCILLSLDTLEELLNNHQQFSLTIAKALRNHQGVFAPIENFCLTLEQAAKKGTLILADFETTYKNTNPALHPKIHCNEIDFNAWSYSLNRLPNNITMTHNIFLTRHLPALYNSIKNQQQVSTRYRRRASWSLSPGKSLVILRDRQTDLADFITNLCVHFIESKKLRYYFIGSQLLPDIEQACTGSLNTNEIEQLISKLPFPRNTWEQFSRLWQANAFDITAFQRLYDILMHHEDFLLHIENDYRDISIDLVEDWGAQILRKLREVDLLHENTQIHIISSNTYSVRQCLSPWIHKNSNKIMAWGEIKNPEIFSANIANQTNKLYALLDSYFIAFPNEKLAMTREEKEHGFLHLSSELFMGIDVDIIDCNKICTTQKDPDIKTLPKDSIIINIDYAFGKQGEDLLGCLISLFGSNIKSINVMGKAGGLCGNRGDLMIANHVLMERSDDVYQLNNHGICPLQLAKDSGRDVFEGTVLTVYGTLLQNHPLLHYYRRFWNCIGLEMEGSFYAREFHRAQHIGILSSEISSRFIYYMSDLPLQEGAQLSVDMSPWELTAPVYSITRSFLKAIAET
jgi:hypothetical protein